MKLCFVLSKWCITKNKKKIQYIIQIFHFSSPKVKIVFNLFGLRVNLKGADFSAWFWQTCIQMYDTEFRFVKICKGGHFTNQFSCASFKACVWEWIRFAFTLCNVLARLWKTFGFAKKRGHWKIHDYEYIFQDRFTI